MFPLPLYLVPDPAVFPCGPHGSESPPLGTHEQQTIFSVAVAPDLLASLHRNNKAYIKTPTLRSFPSFRPPITVMGQVCCPLPPAP